MREKLHKNRLLSFLVLSSIWCLFVWITGLNAWFYFGIFIIADATSWNYVIYRKHKRPKIQKGFIAEWTDAIVFAVVAATIIRSFFIEAYTIPTPSMEKSLLVGDFLFVSKLSYGPRVPMTPVAFPFVHHTLPLVGGKSYIESVKVPYHRMSGFGEIKNNDVVVFNYPAEDTVFTYAPQKDYMQTLYEEAYKVQQRQRIEFPKALNIARKSILQKNETHVRPLDKKENYIKRCIGISGDTLKIVNQQVYINSKLVKTPEKTQFSYDIVGKRSTIPHRKLRKLDHDIARTDIKRERSFKSTRYTLQQKTVDLLKQQAYIDSVILHKEGAGNRGDGIFPKSYEYKWNKDNYGPIYIPKAGDKVKLNHVNIALYARLITEYEHNELEIKPAGIYINNKLAATYTFKQNYYFMMGDNRHNSLDSRFWGFVPENHIVGKAVFIWMSWDSEEKNIFKKIRWNRLFNLIH